jgi:FkbM family methyltransferase
MPVPDASHCLGGGRLPKCPSSCRHLAFGRPLSLLGTFSRAIRWHPLRFHNVWGKYPIYTQLFSVIYCSNRRISSAPVADSQCSAPALRQVEGSPLGSHESGPPIQVRREYKNRFAHDREALMGMSIPYILKRIFLLPYVWYMRWKTFGGRRSESPHQVFFEALYYKPELIRFFKVCVADRDMLKKAPLDKTSIVFDVGAYTGQWSNSINAMYRSPNIYAFEPDEQSYREALHLLGNNKNIRIFNYGLGGKNEEAQLYHNGLGSSIFRGWSRKRKRSSRIELRDVSAVIDELKIESIDLMKINIEGGEYSLLKRLLESGAAKKCKLIMIQYHEWIPGAHRMREELNRELALTHEVEWSYKFVWEKWKRKADVEND